MRVDSDKRQEGSKEIREEVLQTKVPMYNNKMTATPGPVVFSHYTFT